MLIHLIYVQRFKEKINTVKDQIEHLTEVWKQKEAHKNVIKVRVSVRALLDEFNSKVSIIEKYQWAWRQVVDTKGL